MLLRLVGEDTDLASIHKPEARTVSDRLQRLPKNMNKSPAFRDKSLDELLGMEHGSGMGVSTLNDYLNTYSMLFAWAERQGCVQENPFSGLALPTAKTSSRGKRKAFSDDQLQLIERTLLTELAGRTPKPSHKWASLILSALLSPQCTPHPIGIGILQPYQKAPEGSVLWRAGCAQLRTESPWAGGTTPRC